MWCRINARELNKVAATETTVQKIAKQYSWFQKDEHEIETHLESGILNG
jgi:hypothetical protein